LTHFYPKSGEIAHSLELRPELGSRAVADPTNLAELDSNGRRGCGVWINEGARCAFQGELSS
jgi:hypothetical protein